MSKTNCLHLLTQTCYDYSLGRSTIRCTICGALVNERAGFPTQNEVWNERLKQEGYLK